MGSKIVGILGGMGPEATCEVFRRIIQHTNAKTDNEHIRVIIDSHPQIPDRTRAILGKGPSPVEWMIATAKNLERAGANFIIMPCMTAHYFLEDIRAAVTIPIVSAFDLMNEYISQHMPEVEKIGLIATSGTIKTQLFLNKIRNKKIIIPSETTQEGIVMEVIYGKKGIKAGNTSWENIERLQKVIVELKECGAEAIIAGCTEVGLVLSQKHLDLPLIDPLTLLAQRAVLLSKQVHGDGGERECMVLSFDNTN